MGINFWSNCGLLLTSVKLPDVMNQILIVKQIIYWVLWCSNKLNKYIHYSANSLNCTLQHQQISCQLTGRVLNLNSELNLFGLWTKQSIWFPLLLLLLFQTFQGSNQSLQENNQQIINPRLKQYICGCW